MNELLSNISRLKILNTFDLSVSIGKAGLERGFDLESPIVRAGPRFSQREKKVKC